MKKKFLLNFKSITVALVAMVTFGQLHAQNVYDVISGSANHTSLKAAIDAANLQSALEDPNATLTVFGPDNDAFDDLATALGVSIPDLLNDPNLSNILLYHVLGTEVPSSAVTNGLLAEPLNTANTIKMTVTSGGNVFANQAQVNAADIPASNGVIHSLDAVILPAETVVDIALGAGFTTLATAVTEAELLPVLTDPFATLTVFAPTNDAFDDAVAALGISINDLLALPNLADILTYHVLGTEVVSSAINNGDIVAPVSTTNTLKLTVTGAGGVFVNQAQVTTPDVAADNGVVHVLDAVVLPAETVVDVALDAGFTTLATAVIEAELLPVLSDPFATLTVFAPTNDAFDDAVAALGISINDLLALPNLADILTYHVLGSEVLSSAINNGDIVAPVSTTNTLKLTVTGAGGVFVNQAQVTTPDVAADNGVVHVLDAVVLPVETLVDIAIENDLSSLVAAVIAGELVPALSNPFTELTVFAPNNAAFDNLAAALDVSVNDLLELAVLPDILLYHVVAGTVLSTDLVAGPVTTLQGEPVTIDLSAGVQVNNANVIAADVLADNGVAHVIDAVLLPSILSTNEVGKKAMIAVYPNPTTERLFVKDMNQAQFEVVDMMGRTVSAGTIVNDEIEVSTLENGNYVIRISNQVETFQGRFIKQ
ncbi:MAG: fasciclin domain-containing protein [Crocinitomicaceae bacterium]|nr:fasciclin domain-containing protein [Crocinitomicaceae bacterium]